MEKIKVGFAMTGSFCTWDKVVPVLKELTKTYDITPMMSAFSYSADTRFGDCAYWNKQVEEICGFPIDHSFLNCKKELLAYGWQVKKISLKEKTVSLEKIET